MKIEEARIGNFVRLMLSDGTSIDSTITEIVQPNFEKSERLGLEGNMLLNDANQIEGIPLSEIHNGKTWLERCGYGKNIKVYAKYIKYVHELQNWHYWWNNKTEIKIDFGNGK